MSDSPYTAQLAVLAQKITEAQTLGTDPEYAEMAKQEIERLTAEKTMLETAEAQFASGADETVGAEPTKGPCAIEIRPGTGGDEAKIWANDLLRMYVRFCETQKFSVTFIDELIIKIRGTAVIAGKTLSAFETFQFESGVHRVQRVPETESQGRIHTSTASVAVLPEVAQSVISIRDEDLEWQFMRSSGAGGQSVNKTSSAVRLTHKPTGLVATARQEKKQEQNRKIALELLRSQLWEIEEEKRQTTLGKARSAIGRARRAEKIRTYNYPQNRITDHRSKQSWYNLPVILDGALLSILDKLCPMLTAEEPVA
ncbi:MAG: PCRF domain-containing protein [Candidatus Pacebacteria bacterium]|nr:PCRF domain-containing protein [Candidatus Paceibacterota bacterium]PIR60017.1 MAG: peptide chain release factor 1 [Candidatus Pacebacteria bacterium CG10_big_fil_rev_8_21_14_0_10_44_54]